MGTRAVSLSIIAYLWGEFIVTSDESEVGYFRYLVLSLRLSTSEEVRALHRTVSADVWGFDMRRSFTCVHVWKSVPVSFETLKTLTPCLRNVWPHSVSIAKTAIAVSTAVCVECLVHLTTVLRVAERVPTEVHWYTHTTSECWSCDLVVLQQSVRDRCILTSGVYQDHSVTRTGRLGPDARRPARVYSSPDIGAIQRRTYLLW